MNLFSKDSSHLVINIDKFLSQLYITTQSRRAISNWYLFQRLNPNRIILRTNTCRAKISYYAPRRVIRANYSKSIIRLSEVCLILINRKREVHITPKVKDYATPIVCKNNLTDFNSISNPILIVSKCSDIIFSQFKAVKFTL